MPRLPPQRAIDWRAHRIVPSRYPPVGPWDRIADPADFEALAEVEALTNPRIREELGVLALTPPGRRVSGPGTTPVMAAFTHLNPDGSRFSDGSYGVFYAARELETALGETLYHTARFLRHTHEPATRVEMRGYVMRIAARFHDIRGGHRDLHDPDDYAPSQAFGRALRTGGSDGIVYDSVRRTGGQCVAVFWPDRVGRCAQARHYAYCWNGTTITDVLELRRRGL